jgi:hypothetical protein
MHSYPPWKGTSTGTKLLHRHFNLAGSTLKKFIYDTFPEVSAARWAELL